MITAITIHRRTSIGNDLTRNAAIKTPPTPAAAMASDARRLYAPSLINFNDAIGIRNAHEPIMIGKATAGDIPNANTSAIQGAYNPMPAVIKAPKVTIPGTKMGFGGVKNDKSRADLLAYLQSLSDAPKPFPAP